MTLTQPSVTGLKVLKRYLYSDVTLGWTRAEGRVATSVRLSVDDPEVQEALAPLNDLIIKRAQEVVVVAQLEEEVGRRVRALEKEAAENARSRATRDLLEPVDRAVRSLDKVLDSMSRAESTLGKYDIERTRGALRALIQKGA